MERYLLITSVLLLLLYPMYQYLIRSGSHFKFNRIAILTCLLVALILPFLPVFATDLSSRLPAFVKVMDLSGTSAMASGTDSHASPKYHPLFLAWLAGLAFFGLRFIIACGRLIWIMMKAKRLFKWGFLVVESPGFHSPVSLFNLLMISPDSQKHEYLDLILRHETCHRRQGHSLDVLFAEILCSFMWFNPAVWLFRKALRDTHEFLADDFVLQSGADPSLYKHMLFTMQTGISRIPAIAFAGNVSLVKRFKMMNTKSEFHWSKVAYLFLSVLISAFFYNCSESYQAPDAAAEYAEGNNAMYQFISQNMKYPLTARQENRQGTVYVTFTVDEQGDITAIEPGDSDAVRLPEFVVVGYTSSGVSSPESETGEVSEEMTNEVIRVVESLGKFQPAERNGKKVSSQYVLSVEFKLG